MMRNACGGTDNESYDQFYEPYRAYLTPVFAVSGNHDSPSHSGTATWEEPLATFARSFCSPQPVIAREARSLHRTAVTHPGAYFALDAPLVWIIGLFSNVSGGAGLISSDGGKWPGAPDARFEFLAAQLRRIKQESYRGAVLVAVHQAQLKYMLPSASGIQGGNNGGGSDMPHDIDRMFPTKGIHSHMFLSARAHNLQRDMRTVRFDAANRNTPFVVCRNGGHVNPIVRSSRSRPAQGPETAFVSTASKRNPPATPLAGQGSLHPALRRYCHGVGCGAAMPRTAPHPAP